LWQRIREGIPSERFLPGFKIKGSLVPEIIVHGRHVGSRPPADFSHFGVTKPFLREHLAGHIQQFGTGLLAIFPLSHKKSPHKIK
jgi:hypothetical protein